MSRGVIKMENRIREFREKAGLSQVELARRAKVASTNLSSIERGQLMAWPKLRRRLARALKVAEADLFPVEVGNGE
ncbi:MAG: helix-turn-helix domain-containing protein [Dehalococcoidales bacterium]|nr:helix-turn-helix domain-containing protein [Dehalococcoidales bacterium]